MTARTPTPISIGELIRNAAVFNFKNWIGGRSLTSPDSLLQIVQSLFSLLDERKVNYVLVGGVALLSYVEGRNTQDLDLIMAISSLSKLPEIRIGSQERDFAKGEYQGLQIDILLTRNPLFAEIQKKYATKREFLEREIPTATIEGLLLLKLYALPSLYRQGSFVKVGLYENDIATLIHYYQPGVSGLVRELQKYMSESDIAELKEIIADIGQRLKRFREK